MFELLVQMGYKEIEVGFPSASQTDFDFVRELIEADTIPDDVTHPGADPVPRPPDRAHLRRDPRARSRRSSTSTTRRRSLQRRVVFGLDQDGIVDIAVQGARLCKKLEETIPDTDVYYEYSPESYTGTELEFAVRICNEVARRHRPDARPQDDHQPAGDRRDGDAQRLRRLDRVDGPPPRAARVRRRVAAPAQRPRHRRRGRRAGLPRRRRPHRGLPVRQRRAHRQRLPGHPRA